MNKEYEYFGNKIVQYGYNNYVGYVYNADGDIIQIKGDSLSDVKEKINKFLLNRDIDNLYDKINGEYNISRECFDFFLNMISSFHSTNGAAVMNMEDYCNRHI